MAENLAAFFFWNIGRRYGNFSKRQMNELIWQFCWASRNRAL